MPDSPQTTTLPPISSIADHVGGSCEDGYLVQFILTDEAEYRAWMAWLRGQRIKGLQAAPVFSMAADAETTTARHRCDRRYTLRWAP